HPRRPLRLPQLRSFPTRRSSDLKETIATGTAAAAAGGFTSVCCMPNTSPVVDSPEWVHWIRQPERGALVNVFPIAAATHHSKGADRKSTRLNSSHVAISYAVFCL